MVVVINALTTVSHATARYATARPLQPGRQVGVNNLPKVVDLQLGYELMTIKSQVEYLVYRVTQPMVSNPSKQWPT